MNPSIPSHHVLIFLLLFKLLFTSTSIPPNLHICPEKLEVFIPLMHEVPESKDGLLVGEVEQVELGTEALGLKKCHCTLMKVKRNAQIP